MARFVTFSSIQIHQQRHLDSNWHNKTATKNKHFWSRRNHDRQNALQEHLTNTCPYWWMALQGPGNKMVQDWQPQDKIWFLTIFFWEHHRSRQRHGNVLFCNGGHNPLWHLSQSKSEMMTISRRQTVWYNLHQEGTKEEGHPVSGSAQHVDFLTPYYQVSEQNTVLTNGTEHFRVFEHRSQICWQTK